MQMYIVDDPISANVDRTHWSLNEHDRTQCLALLAAKLDGIPSNVHARCTHEPMVEITWAFTFYLWSTCPDFASMVNSDSCFHCTIYMKLRCTIYKASLCLVWRSPVLRIHLLFTVLFACDLIRGGVCLSRGLLRCSVASVWFVSWSRRFSHGVSSWHPAYAIIALYFTNFNTVQFTNQDGSICVFL